MARCSARFAASRVPAWAADIDATSWGQIFLKYVLAHPAVAAAIPATGKVHHLEDNLSGARGRLPDAQAQSGDRSRLRLTCMRGAGAIRRE